MMWLNTIEQKFFQSRIIRSVRADVFQTKSSCAVDEGLTNEYGWVEISRFIFLWLPQLWRKAVRKESIHYVKP